MSYAHFKSSGSDEDLCTEFTFGENSRKVIIILSSTYLSIKEAIKESIKGLIKDSIMEQIKELIKELIKESIKEYIKELRNEPIKE